MITVVMQNAIKFVNKYRKLTKHWIRIISPLYVVVVEIFVENL